LSREALDRIAGLPSGYVSKLLSPAPMKHFGPISFGPINGALGLKLIAVEDPEAMRAHAALRTANKAVRPVRLSKEASSMDALRTRIMRRNAQKACRARNEKLSASERSQSAQNAALTRWARLSPDERHKALRPANEARSPKRKRGGRASRL
jgi:hypothetical protein